MEIKAAVLYTHTYLRMMSCVQVYETYTINTFVCEFLTLFSKECAKKKEVNET